MKTLICWSVTLGLVASTLFSTGLSQLPPVLALSKEEVVKVLNAIPAFILIDDKNFPLAGKIDDKTIFTNVFMSQQGAQQFLASLQKEKPDLASKYKVELISLGGIYQLAQQNSNQSQRYLLQYIPNQAEVEAAKPILSASGKQYEGGVPLYLARGGQQQSYLTMEQNGETITPVFFEKKTIQAMVDNVTKQEPNLAPTVKIEVVLLDNLITTLEEKNDTFIKSIRLWPSEEMMGIIRSNQSNQGNKPQ